MMVLGALKDSPILNSRCNIDFNLTPKAFAKSLCAISAGGGHLAVLKCTRAHGYPRNTQTCAAAATNGHLGALH